MTLVRFLFVIGLLFVHIEFTYASGEQSKIWESSRTEDEFNGNVTYSVEGKAGSFVQVASEKMFIPNRSYSIGVRCDVSRSSSQDFMLTFNVKDALATPNSPAHLLIKIDENKPYEFRGKLYSNSYRSGFVRLTPSNKSQIVSLITEAKAGDRMLVRVFDERKSSIENYSILLKGFTKGTKEALDACGVMAKALNISDADSARLKEIDLKIKQLETEKEQIKGKY